MTIDLELQIATDAKTLPHPSQFREWVNVALSDEIEQAELTIRIVDEQESAELNKRFRDKDKPTNVLAFSYDSYEENTHILFGDIVICAPIVEAEVVKNDKDLLAHWAHLVIHGILHLQGYDHQHPKEAEMMEAEENKLMEKLKFPPPYKVSH